MLRLFLEIYLRILLAFQRVLKDKEQELLQQFGSTEQLKVQEVISTLSDIIGKSKDLAGINMWTLMYCISAFKYDFFNESNFAASTHWYFKHGWVIHIGSFIVFSIGCYYSWKFNFSYSLIIQLEHLFNRKEEEGLNLSTIFTFFKIYYEMREIQV